jgi:hypothetical protein
MRLSNVNHGHRLRQKLMLILTRIVGFWEPLDVTKTFMYRPEFFGRPFCNLAHAILRGPSDWSVGERELLGAFTAKLNQCRF